MAINRELHRRAGRSSAARRHRGTTAVNVNQLDPRYLALGSAVLNQSVANPFAGNPAFAARA